MHVGSRRSITLSYRRAWGDAHRAACATGHGQLIAIDAFELADPGGRAACQAVHLLGASALARRELLSRNAEASSIDEGAEDGPVSYPGSLDAVGILR